MEGSSTARTGDARASRRRAASAHALERKPVNHIAEPLGGLVILLEEAV
jgi:hypothetical protein